MSHTPFLTERFEDALAYAHQLHRIQKRRGTDVPYISHLLSVAALALEHGASEDEAIAALLHDAVEDAGGASTMKEIERRFGDVVAAIVDGCTDAYEHPKPEWRPRKENFIARLAHANDSVLLVTACDKLHNVRAILLDLLDQGDDVWSKFKVGKDETLWYYRSAAAALRRHGAPPGLVGELDRTLSAIEKAAG